jgi:hypothetical protein
MCLCASDTYEMGQFTSSECFEAYRFISSSRSLHVIIEPLYLLDYVQGRMDDELIHVAGRLSIPEPCQAVTTSFGSTKGVLKQWGICRRNDNKIVRHALGRSKAVS